MDFRELRLSAFIKSFTIDADVCSSKMRDYRRMETKMSTWIIDLSKAEAQIRMQEILWPFQIIFLKIERFYLTPFDLGFNAKLCYS